MYFDTGIKSECFGCEGCVQGCPFHAIKMVEDSEGFRYPNIDDNKCKNCGICRKICPCGNLSFKRNEKKYVFGGYNKNSRIRFDSTSGGAFSAIVDAFCDDNYVIFGAESDGLVIRHSFISNKAKIGKFRKSKYSQSIIGDSYREARKFLKEGKKVLFTGTPCQIAGLNSFLEHTDTRNLLTVDVICEGVPSPLYLRKMEKEVIRKYNNKIESIDYRYTGKSIFRNGTWDFQKMKITFCNGKQIVKDRWFNPFWSIWLQHLMSRPSCYKCPFARSERVSDISLGDLWGVHIYCPDLYGNNGGSSLVVCNTEVGKSVFRNALKFMYGRELAFENALKYQSPLRNPISENEFRGEFMFDLNSNIDLNSLNRKWAKKPSVKLIFQKYIWGNRQKIFVWKIRSFLNSFLRVILERNR